MENFQKQYFSVNYSTVGKVLVFQMHFVFPPTRDISLQRCSARMRTRKGGMGGNFQSLHFSTRCTLNILQLIPTKLFSEKFNLDLEKKSREAEREGKNKKPEKAKTSPRIDEQEPVHRNMSIHMVFFPLRSKSGGKKTFFVRSSSCNAKVVE